MNYLPALIIYLASLGGIAVCLCGMVESKRSPKFVAFFSVCSLAFCFTLYLGGVMINAS
jgi:hypothetical protein